MEETWDLEVTYKVKGKEVYTNVQTWEGLKPEKVLVGMKIMQEAQQKFVDSAGR